MKKEPIKITEFDDYCHAVLNNGKTISGKALSPKYQARIEQLKEAAKIMCE